MKWVVGLIVVVEHGFGRPVVLVRWVVGQRLMELGFERLVASVG